MWCSSRAVGVAALLLLAACSSSPKDSGGGGSGPAPTGALLVQVAGLPPGTSARVTVTGPAGFNRNITGTTQLTGLAEGVYRVTAGFVNAQSQTFTGLPSPDSATVTAGDTAVVTVTYTGGPVTSLNLSVAGTQLIQSSQRADGGVPMVAGRDALLRVFVTASGANTARPAVRVRLFAGATAVDSVDVAAPGLSVPQSVDTSSLAASWNVLIPAARVTGTLGYQVDLDPDDAVSETDEADNRWPAGGGVRAVTVQSVPAFNLRFVPVRQSANNLTGRVSDANKDAFAEPAKRIFPLAAMTVDVRSVYTTSAPPLAADDSNNAWGQILNETSAVQASDGSGRHYVSIVQVNYGGGIAGLGWVGAPAAVAWDKTSSAPGVIAHEIGHNFGLRHAPCGNPSGPDPSYPYAGGVIGVWGLDLPALTLKSPAMADLMSYCHPEWISDYNYLSVLSRRGPGPDVRPAGAVSDGLVVWGRIVAGRAILEPAFLVHAPARLPDQPGRHRVDGLDAAGNRVFSLSFEGGLVPDLPGGDQRHFVFVVPLDAAERGRLESLRLTGAGLTALRTASAARRAVPARGMAPGAVRAARVGGEAEVRWDAAYPMAVIRDAATGEILALARGGSARVGARSRQLSVELSDGVAGMPRVLVTAP